MKRHGWLYGAIADVAYITVGSGCFGLSVALFSAPNDIAPGGVTGLSTLANYLWGLPIGALTIAVNVPLVLLAWWRLGRSFAARTLLGLAISSVVIDSLSALLPPFSADRLLAAVFGGVLSGLGLGLILSRGATTGGAEVVARLLERRWPHIPIGKLLLALDGGVIALSALVYRQLESPLYAIILVFVASLLTDRLVYGGRRGRVALIISRRHAAITRCVLHELGRGITLLTASGGFTGAPQPVLLCATRRTEIYSLKQLVYATDPEAFVLLLTADEVLGSGFSTLNEG
jgi:uncharacterized membrane-anchored protein YitT (DUF2179 family)